MARISTALVASTSALLLAPLAQAQNLLPIALGRALPGELRALSCDWPDRGGPLPKAPPFRILHRRYPVENLAEAFAEGIKVAHPMPEFRLEAGQIEDLIAYLKSLER